MGADERDVKRATEPLQFKVVGGPEDYGDTGDSTIRYVVVANSAGILGYLWAADDHDSAGYVPRPAGGGSAFNAGTPWTMKLRGAKARHLKPSQALAELSKLPGDEQMGRVVPGSEAEAPSLAALKELASRA
jgi:hypothetical protein